MPSAPSARSAESRARRAAICPGAAGRCQPGLAMLARNADRLASGSIPATASIRAIAQDAANP